MNRDIGTHTLLGGLGTLTLKANDLAVQCSQIFIFQSSVFSIVLPTVIIPCDLTYPAASYSLRALSRLVFVCKKIVLKSLRRILSSII